ncbi:MAG: CehA/McbA family metallohydrolase [Candidatus Hydrogenedentes bacterium]|nr:CehA/McbA family metallohydrolase [Candidatus Hydrogenedentota bacterium]
MGASAAPALPPIDGIPPQPLMAQALRIVDALSFLGSTLSDADAARIRELEDAAHTPELAHELQEILDRYCLAVVNINPESRVKLDPGPADPNLIQDGWKVFLIKVHNEAATRAAMRWESPNAEPSLHVSSGAPEPKPESLITPGQLGNRFLTMAFHEKRPMTRELTGFPLEYKILQIYASAAGPREAQISFNVGSGTEDLGYRNALPVLFDCKPSVKVVLDVRDEDDAPVMAGFVIRDNVDRLDPEDPKIAKDYRLNKALSAPWQRQGLDTRPLVGVYPLPARRVAATDPYPDFFFQPQIYRKTGEHVMLPPGDYEFTVTRGPEYLSETRTVNIPDDGDTYTVNFKLKRWIHMKEKGWFSADHHVHAGGCSHYESPEAGVKPAAMMRQAEGEDLNVACVLTWGPCWYHQKTFFEGKVSDLSSKEYQMRYDVEVSGFPSSHAGHLCLLRLSEDDYPGTTKIEEWPSWTLPVLQWGKDQGGVVGYSHSGWGLEPMAPTDELPNYVTPKFDGIGANEYIVTAVHDAVDFISAGDTPLTMELNIWYHILNCGFRTAISGETDYPCIFDDRVGMARSYAKVEGGLSFDAFMDHIKAGANYVSDGRSHLYNFSVNGAALTTNGNEIQLAQPGTLSITAEAAAYLPEQQDEAGARIAASGVIGRPYWHIEKARVGVSRKVPVELVVNGYAVDKVEIEADGSPQPIAFQHTIDKSSWVALRILYSAHTNPVYAIVADQPVRASKRSAQWCIDAVDQCFTMKEPAIRKEEKKAALEAYDRARQAYQLILDEAYDDRVAAPGVVTSVQLLPPRPQPEKGELVGVQSGNVTHTQGWLFSYANNSSFEGYGYWTLKGAGSETFTWDCQGVTPGIYEVHAWVQNDPRKDHATNAHYHVLSADGAFDAFVDQTKDYQTWHRLGQFRLSPHSKIILDNNADGNVVADALLLIPAN